MIQTADELAPILTSFPQCPPHSPASAHSATRSSLCLELSPQVSRACPLPSIVLWTNGISPRSLLTTVSKQQPSPHPLSLHLASFSLDHQLLPDPVVSFLSSVSSPSVTLCEDADLAWFHTRSLGCSQLRVQGRAWWGEGTSPGAVRHCSWVTRTPWARAWAASIGEVAASAQVPSY